MRELGETSKIYILGCEEGGQGAELALEVELQGVRQLQKDTRPHGQSFPTAGQAASGAGGGSSPLLEICKRGCCREAPSTTWAVGLMIRHTAWNTERHKL